MYSVQYMSSYITYLPSFGAHPLTKKPRDAGNEIACVECTETPLGPIKHATFSSPELRSYWSTILDAGAMLDAG